jgi:hypothetical protein
MTIEPGAFNDKTRQPTPAALAGALKKAQGLWEELVRLISDQHAPITREWIYGGSKYGWSLRLKQKKRAVVYLTPCDGYFRAALALGEKAVRAAGDGVLSARERELIDEAPRYAEGRAIRIEIRRPADVLSVARFTALKMAN